MARKQKGLLFKPTPISRLRHYKYPIKMVGDPDWGYQSHNATKAWARREKAVYEYEMERKTWPMPWSQETWHIACVANQRIDRLIMEKWDDWDEAWLEHAEMSYDEANRDNAAWDYHHEYTPDLEEAS